MFSGNDGVRGFEVVVLNFLEKRLLLGLVEFPHVLNELADPDFLVLINFAETFSGHGTDIKFELN